MYADDAVIFINPTRSDVANFADILHRFGTTTGLVTNLQKSQVAAIRCDNIDLKDVLEGVPAMRANFPIKYLGLPLFWEDCGRWTCSLSSTKSQGG